MQPITLCGTTGVLARDAYLCVIIERLEQRFPQRVRGYYLVGSYAVGEALPASDLDVLAVFSDEIAENERSQFADVRAECKRLGACALDLAFESEAKLFRVGGVWFQTASQLLYKHDLRASIPRKPVADHQRDLMHAVYPLIARVRGNPPLLSLPLDYPDRNSQMYGYDQRHVATAAGLNSVGTKDLVNIVLAIASALTLQRAGQYTGTGKKSDIPRQYRAWIGDEWSALVEDSYTLCRNTWGYALPAHPADRARLRAMCQHVLDFENTFLSCYYAWLRAEMHRGDTVRARFAAERLQHINDSSLV